MPRRCSSATRPVGRRSLNRCIGHSHDPKTGWRPIPATAELSIAPEETAGELEERLSDLGVEPTLSAISKLEDWDGTRVLGCNQDPQSVTEPLASARKRH